MFTLLKYCVRALQQIPERNVLIVGLDNAGKTSLLNDIRGTPISDPVPTIGQNFAKIKHNKTMLTFWDLGGQVKFRGFWKNYFSDVDAIVYVVDSADNTRLQESAAEFKKLIARKELRHAPICLVVNKQDLVNSADVPHVSDVCDDDIQNDSLDIQRQANIIDKLDDAERGVRPSTPSSASPRVGNAGPMSKVPLDNRGRPLHVGAKEVLDWVSMASISEAGMKRYKHRTSVV